MTNQDQCREAFEAWARKDGTWEVVRDDKVAAGITSYTDFNLALAWHTWQAARSAAATGMPAGWVAVPVEPTEAMRSVIINESDVYQSPDALYAALLAAAPKLPQGDGWLPIESAPKNQLVMVYSPPQNDDHPEAIRIVFDYIDAGIADGYWYAHGESYEHFCCVAKPEGCTGPSEKAPYTHWHPIPQPPKEEKA